uniref:Peptide-N(4)-(N-acetyl-beta-glucosaminyl)asparagine amidase n=1 Tax=Cuerna arida TaxID=1464854 RepID=A0A1B6G378_9HEMI
MSMFKCIESLEENPAEVFLQVTSILLRLVDNVLHYPSDPKYRKLRLENKLISTVIMPSIGAMECLFEIGFQEGEDALLLPPESTSIEKLKRFREEIAKRRSKYLKDNNSTNNETSQNKSNGNSERQSTPQPGAAATSQSRPVMSHNINSNSTQTQNPFLEKLRQHSAMVLQYEEEDTKRKALAVLPLIEINERVERRMRQHQQHARKSGQPINEDSLQETLFFTELMCWFKNDFFEWVNSPKCSQCDCDTSFVETSTTLLESIRVEVYKCGKCSAKLTFPRYNEAKKLLETRKGRCGEWANAFTAVVRALNWDARLVSDESDHAWTEVYFKSEGRWVHCDPCECALDKPLLYEKGWKKQLSYVIGFSCEDVQDVTWRYSANHSALLTRRRLCTEQQLVRTIEELNHLRQTNLSSARRKALAKRTLIELVQLMLPASDTEGDTQGRQSGSLAWRLARAETSLAQSGSEISLGQEENKAYVWTPTAEEVREKRMVINYCTGTDLYSRGPVEERVRGWRTRTFAAENIFRKEEKDWKTAYLCRTENSTEGRISWQVDLTTSELRVGDVEVQCPATTYENGTVLWLLCSGDKCVRVSDGHMKTSELRGSSNLTLTATLKGGKGDVAWQHAQLFRQPLNATDTSFSLSLSFISP